MSRASVGVERGSLHLLSDFERARMRDYRDIEGLIRVIFLLARFTIFSVPCCFRLFLGESLGLWIWQLERGLERGLICLLTDFEEGGARDYGDIEGLIWVIFFTRSISYFFSTLLF